MERSLVIDADQLVYACGFVTEDEPLSHACQLVKKKLQQIYEDCGTDNASIYIGGEGNFRDDIDFDYKAHRVAPRPKHYDGIRDYLVNVQEAYVVDDMETDDEVSMHLWHDYCYSSGDPEKCSVVLVSPDKDLNNTPGWHHNPRTRETYWVTPKQADRHFHYQLLRGDPSDNIKGLPYCAQTTIIKHGLHRSAKKGCGEKAAKLIMEAEDYTAAVYEAYAAWGQEEGLSQDDTLDYFTRQGQLLWMVREFDEFDDPVLWEPHGLAFDHTWDHVKSEDQTCEGD